MKDPWVCHIATVLGHFMGWGGVVLAFAPDVVVQTIFQTTHDVPDKAHFYGFVALIVGVTMILLSHAVERAGACLGELREIRSAIERMAARMSI